LAAGDDGAAAGNYTAVRHNGAGSTAARKDIENSAAQDHRIADSTAGFDDKRHTAADDGAVEDVAGANRLRSSGEHVRRAGNDGPSEKLESAAARDGRIVCRPAREHAFQAAALDPVIDGVAANQHELNGAGTNRSSCHRAKVDRQRTATRYVN